MTLVSGLLTQLRVIHALILRETKTRFGQYRGGYLWALLEPLFWIGTFYGLYAIAGRKGPPGMDLIPFLATGIVTYQTFAQTVERVGQSINANKALLFYPQVQTLDLVFARTLLEFTTFLGVFIVLVGGHALAIQSLTMGSVLMTVWGMALASLLGMTFGLIVCALNVVSTTLDKIRAPLMRPLFWVSGLFFTADALPSRVRDVMLWNPLLHCVELTRDGWFPEYHARFANSMYVICWIVALAFIGLTLERVVRPKVQLS